MPKASLRDKLNACHVKCELVSIFHCGYMLKVNELSGGNPSARFKRSDGCRGGWMWRAWSMGREA